MRKSSFGQALMVAGLCVLASAAQAQNTETFTASATVSSSLSIVENTPLSFGNLVVVKDSAGADMASARLSPAGGFTVTTLGPANLVQIGTATAGNFTVDVGVPAFINVQVQFPTVETTLRNVEAPSTNGTFTVDSFQIATPAEGEFAGTTTSLADCLDAMDLTAGGTGRCQFTTSNTGLLTFSLGASITMDSGSATYRDGVYAGDFDLTASFF